MTGREGSRTEFDTSWKGRSEAHYNHWCSGPVRNQIQLAFRSHWEALSELLERWEIGVGRSLEVGCGRGSLSSYFADAGWDAWLLDYSGAGLASARNAFEANGHRGQIVQGDANQLPLKSATFDVTFSVGLLEHFEDVAVPMREQMRILRPGGAFIGYIVPERPDNLQMYFNWINKALGVVARAGGGAPHAITKQPLFRNDYASPEYTTALDGLIDGSPEVFGMYSMPMISHSPEFPFSLLPAPLERALVTVFRGALGARRMLLGRHGWICAERWGQAFVVAARKRR